MALEAIEADTATERATTLLTNLGFSPELRGRAMSALSGGWRVRTALTLTLTHILTRTLALGLAHALTLALGLAHALTLALTLTLNLPSFVR